MAYIYLHRRNDTGEVFYVGKGTGNRATSTKGRNEHWHRVVNKAGFTAEIIAKGLTEEEAYWAEPLLIEAHGGVQNLTNMSDGGEGFSSAEAAKVATRQWQDPAFREKISKARKEMWKDPAYREKMSKATKEMWKDPAFRENRSKAAKEQLLEQWQDPAFREKISEARSRQLKKQWQDPAYRKLKSEQVKEQHKRGDFPHRGPAPEVVSEVMKERWQDPEYRKLKSEQVKEQHRQGKLGKKWRACADCSKKKRKCTHKTFCVTHKTYHDPLTPQPRR